MGQHEVGQLQIASTHYEDQPRGAEAELRGRDELLEQGERVSPAEDLAIRIRGLDHAHTQAELGLAYAEQRLEALRERHERTRSRQCEEE